VARIVYVRATIGGKPRFVLVHVAADGLITDYDVVER
jgi:hypothetical protein